jgi:hypothetical protein
VVSPNCGSICYRTPGTALSSIDYSLPGACGKIRTVPHIDEG